jgi:hypothetical protein
LNGAGYGRIKAPCGTFENQALYQTKLHPVVYSGARVYQSDRTQDARTFAMP